MPPGWDGLETIENLWKVDPDIQVVLCSAYTDYDWLELPGRLGHSDKLIVIKKPFEPIEVLQSASALSRKWQNARALRSHVESLERVVTDRTRGLLEVELTETAVMSDAEQSVHLLEAISRMGVLIAVDDFGTGYSSMSYLRRFPIDKLKIDRCFVEQMTGRPEDASIVRAIISLAHSLRLKVIAEGVETPDQLQLLAELGCDQYQGFYVSPALPPSQFAALLQRESQPADEDAVRTHSKRARLAG
jgi:predicted signal transduction protein with EAL and GGDEF domain